MKQEDYDFIEEEEENKDYAYKKNAGGYTDGVLIDYLQSIERQFQQNHSVHRLY